MTDFEPNAHLIALPVNGAVKAPDGLLILAFSNRHPANDSIVAAGKHRVTLDYRNRRGIGTQRRICGGPSNERRL